jgi:glycosyltransferase involved in cell wall biosynthesis
VRLLLAVNDLLVYEAAITQPTGIQRVASRLADALVANPRPFMDCITVSLSRDGVRQVRLRTGSTSPLAQIAEPLLRLLARLPRSVQERVRSSARRALSRRASRSGNALRVEPGDWIAVLGAPWIAPGMADAVLRNCASSGARLALLVHDLLPTAAPGWFADSQGREAHDDMSLLIRRADAIFTVSPEVASEVAARFGPSAQAILPADVSFAQAPTTTGSARNGEYVLFVGTLHPRKNLVALVEVWRSWALKVGADAVPRLLIVGRRHPQDTALFASLDALERVDGGVPGLRSRIHLVHDADDRQIASLYAGCRFLVLPSLAEGWGLPVREALCANRPSIATDAVPAALHSPFSSVVPAGDVPALAQAIRGWWETTRPEELAAQISREFRPRTWGDVAAEIKGALAARAN